jgi:uncharacterized protein YndB with AHSA1/START domain
MSDERTNRASTRHRPASPIPDRDQPRDDRELVIIRTFDAPRDLVWKAWTDPERIAEWMAPAGFTIPFNEGDMRPGGAWRCHMRAPDGVEHRCSGVYREIVPPERLVFTHAWLDEDDHRGPETVVTVTFIERDGRTVMSFRQGLFQSTASRDGHGGGWAECFDRLDAMLARG